MPPLSTLVQKKKQKASHESHSLGLCELMLCLGPHGVFGTEVPLKGSSANRQLEETVCTARAVSWMLLMSAMMVIQVAPTK